MTIEQWHERCQTLQQALTDLIAAVIDLQEIPEREHLQVVLEAAMRLVADDIPPLDGGVESEASG